MPIRKNNGHQALVSCHDGPVTGKFLQKNNEGKCGVPEDCVPQAIACMQIAARDKAWDKPPVLIRKRVAAPDLYLSDK